jgi:hypothetical protein
VAAPSQHENARSPSGEKRATTRDEARTEPSPGSRAGVIANAFAGQQRGGAAGSSLRAQPSPAIPSNESKRYLERSPENASQIKVTRAAEDEARHLVAAPAYLYLPGWGRACAKGLCCPVPYPSYLNASCGDPSLRQPFVCPRVGTYSIFLDLKCSDGSSSAA